MAPTKNSRLISPPATCCDEWAMQSAMASAHGSWWFTRVLESRRVLVRDMRDALGWMSFVYGALASDRPFLGPLYSYVAVTELSAVHEPPVFVLLIIRCRR